MINRIVFKTGVGLLLLLVLPAGMLRAGEKSAGVLQAASCPYHEWRVTPFPSADTVVTVNPVALLWPSEKYLHHKGVLYNVYLSQDSTFQDNTTMKSLKQRYCFFNPHHPLKPGKWYWRYEVLDPAASGTLSQPIDMGRYTFQVRPQTEGLSTPSFEEFISHVPKSYPRVINYGRPLEEIRRQAPSHPLYQTILRRAEQLADRQPYDGPVEDRNPAKARKLNQKAGKEVEIFHSLLEGYILCGDEKLYEAILQRLEILLTWPTDDLLGSKVLSALSECYDALYPSLSEEMKSRIERTVDRQLCSGLKKWSGYTEARHVENHFWQMELAGNFKAALVMLGRLESAREMLEYTYGLFLARFPNLAEQDGGWAEGEGYYSVNQTAIVDMALVLKKVGGIDIFKMGWYRNLTDYFTYFSPVAAQVSGFGDMHDRVASGSLKGRAEMLMLGCEEGNRQSLYRLFASLRPDDSYYGMSCPDDYWKKPLSKTEPWYQVVNDIRITPADAVKPSVLPCDKVFFGVGAAALHTDVYNPGKDVAVFFRSSPFGAKGHMHANQNAFNIARKGERIFYSTGYYTSFADPHSLTSYRHTRAHNTILVDGMGQAYGHEGYGRILCHEEGKLLSYVCGDASNAYRKVTDTQFVELLKKNKVADGFGDSGLKLFRRHLFFVRPDIVVIYDELEAVRPVQWSLLLHTLHKPELVSELGLKVETERSLAEAVVFSGAQISRSYTDQFYSPAVDFKKKYPGGTPLEHHFMFSNVEKSSAIRFLTIIQLTDKGKECKPVKQVSAGKWKIGKVTVEAELSVNRKAFVKVNVGKESMTGFGV